MPVITKVAKEELKSQKQIKYGFKINLDSYILAPRTVSKYLCVVSSYLVGGNLLQCLQDMDTPAL